VTEGIHIAELISNKEILQLWVSFFGRCWLEEDWLDRCLVTSQVSSVASRLSHLLTCFHARRHTTHHP